MSIIKEFQDFIARGNAMDLAVGIIMGNAFTKIVNSIVNDLIMPPIGALMQGRQFEDVGIVIQQAPDPKNIGADGIPVGEVSIRIGKFINVLIEFIIIAIAVFLVVKIMNSIIAAREKYIPIGLGGEEELPKKEEPPKT